MPLRVVLAAIVAFVLGWSVPSPVSAAGEIADQASEEQTVSTLGMVEIGRVPVTAGGTNGWMVLDPARRRAYQFSEEVKSGFPIISGNGITQFVNDVQGGKVPRPWGHGRTTMRSFNLDTLAPVRTGVVAEQGTPILGGGSGQVGPALDGPFGDVVHAVDPVKKRVFVAITDRGPISSGLTPAMAGSDGTAGVFSHVAVIDEEKFDRGEAGYLTEIRLPQGNVALAQHRLRGVVFTRAGMSDASDGKLLLFFAAPSAPIAGRIGVFDHYLVQWDVGSRLAGSPVGPGEWMELLTACAGNSSRAGGKDSYYQAAILRTEDRQRAEHAVYLACLGRTADSGQVVRVGLDPATGTPLVNDQQVFPLGRTYTDSLVDPVAGRLYLRQLGGGSAGSTWWVFDATVRNFTSAFAGHSGAVNPPAAGIDPVRGRFYTLVPDQYFVNANKETLPLRGGLAYTDGRLHPVPQLTYTRTDLAYPGLYSIAVDPVARRVFVRLGRGDQTSRIKYPGTTLDTPAPVEDFYRVLEDRIPDPAPPGQEDDSQRTIDVDENPALTSASYLATGSGFGTRMLLTGGLSAFSRAVAGQDLFDKFALDSACGADDRELTLGRVSSASVSSNSASASALGADVSPSTRDDLERPVMRCWPNPAAFGNLGSSNPYPRSAPHPLSSVEGMSFDPEEFEAECADTGGETKTPERHAQDYHATVSCDRETEAVFASAHGAITGALPLVTVEKSSAEVSIERLDTGGVAVSVDSIARGIAIEGVGSIGVVRLEVSVVVTGRPSEQPTVFVRTLCAVAFQNFQEPACTTDPQRHQQIASVVTSALGGRGKARVRMPDPRLAGGSPYGFQAAIQRDEVELFEDAVISRDASIEVPGLELIFYNGDSPTQGAGRQIFQFAGAFGTSSYGIQCKFGRMADGRACSPPLSFDFEQSAPPVASPAPVSLGRSAGPPASVAEAQAAGDQYELVGLSGNPAANLSVPDATAGGTDGGLFDTLADAAGKVLRLLFGRSLGEALLHAAVWLLLFLPCYLGERWRLIARLRVTPRSHGTQSIKAALVTGA